MKVWPFALLTVAGILQSCNLNDAQNVDPSSLAQTSSSLASSSSQIQSSSSAITKIPVTAVDTNYALLVDRAGGGNIHFFVSAADSILWVTVTKIDFQDTLLNLRIEALNDTLRQAIQAVMDSSAVLTGDFAQPSLETGTWLEYYVNKNDQSTRITNEQLRNALDGLEIFVRNNLTSAYIIIN